MANYKSQYNQSNTDTIPLPSEWWRVNGMLQECLSNHDTTQARNILSSWHKRHVVTSNYFECLIDIYITRLRDVMANSKSAKHLASTEREEIINLLKSDCQRGVNLALGSQKQAILNKWQTLKELYDQYCQQKQQCAHTNRNNTRQNQTSSFPEKKTQPNYNVSIPNHGKSKEEIQQKFETILHGHKETLRNLKNLDFRHDSLKKIRKDYISKLEELIYKINAEYKTVRDEIVWDHLVIGFFGETNAGKSTIIETLRLRYSSDKNTWNHGEIVGLGASDFTKDASEYKLNINGKRVTLIDIPGIEGDESKYSKIIAKALRRAHYVFYVHKKNSRPDVKIASKIQHYLSDWTRVCSVYNVSNSIGNYDEAEDRVNLYTESVIKQGAIIKEAFQEMLGALYEENITLQAQVGLCASSEFSNSVKLSSDAKKLRKYFKDSETAYNFSRFNSLISLLDRLNNSFDKVILDSQNQKLKALKKRSRQKLEEFDQTHKDFLSQLEVRLKSMSSDVKKKIQSSKNVIKNRCESIIHRTFSSVERAICDTIENSKNNHKAIEAKISNIIYRNLEYTLPNEINKECREIIRKMTQDIQNRIKEINSVDIRIPNITIDLDFQYQVDTDSIIQQLKVSLGDVLDVGTGAASGTAIGAIFGPIGMGVGALIGAGAAVAKKKFFGDGGVGKAKNAAKEELNVCRAECIEELRQLLRNIDTDLTRLQNQVVMAISKESNSLRDMQNKQKDIYQIL